jgi:hypothetical protein
VLEPARFPRVNLRLVVSSPTCRASWHSRTALHGNDVQGLVEEAESKPRRAGVDWHHPQNSDDMHVLYMCSTGLCQFCTWRIPAILDSSPKLHATLGLGLVETCLKVPSDLEHGDRNRDHPMIQAGSGSRIEASGCAGAALHWHFSSFEVAMKRSERRRTTIMPAEIHAQCLFLCALRSRTLARCQPRYP